MIHTDKNRNILRLAGGILFISLLVLLLLVYAAIQRKVMREAHATVSNLLHIQQSIRSYVKQVMRPEIYRLEQEGILTQGYFSPELMSRSFVSTEILKLFNQRHHENNLGVRFRYASISPLNLANKADERESELIQRFERGELQEYEQIISVNGLDSLYFARPLDRFEADCMYCHGDPTDAPASLTTRYGTAHGFQRRVGELSGIMSITIPLQAFRSEGVKAFVVVAAGMLAVFTLIFIFFYLMLRHKDVHDQILLQKNQELDRLSTTDVLTGVANRLHFNQEVDRLIAQARSESVPLCMLLLDLDHFKLINDRYGHDVGDQVLQRFGGFLRRICRRTDFIARYGGEEFVVLLQNMNVAELEQYARRLLEQMPEVEYPHGLRVKASIGLAILEPGEDKNSFFCRADKAMYCSKKKGRYCYTMAPGTENESQKHARTDE